MDVKELNSRFTEFCDGKACEQCEYQGRKTCQMEWAFNEGCKYTFNTAVDLLNAFKTGGDNNGHNQR